MTLGNYLKGLTGEIDVKLERTTIRLNKSHVREPQLAHLMDMVVIEYSQAKNLVTVETATPKKD